MHFSGRRWDGAVGQVFRGELTNHCGVVAEILAVGSAEVGVDFFA